MNQLVPQFIVENHLQGQISGTFTAVAIQVDISGFTNLTNIIMVQDRDNGGEAVADMMRLVFTPLIETLTNHGGFVAMFAGDAFTALFPYDPNEITRSATIRQAVTAAWIMRQQVSTLIHTSHLGEFRFAVKIGAGQGTINWRIFHADPDQQAQHETLRSVYTFQGSGLQNAITALELCGRNEIALEKTLLTGFNNPQIKMANTEDSNFVFVTELSELAAEQSDTETRTTRDTSQQPLPFISSALQEKNDIGQFRQVVSVFVGIDEPIDDLAELIPLTKIVYKLQATYGGYLNAMRYTDKGGVLVMFWGAPQGLERDTILATNFAHQLRNQSPFPLRIGLSYRWLYAGLIGSDLRQDYTCYGGGTSFSARLMISAESGQILLDDALAARIDNFFWLTPLGARPMKGFDRPQEVYRLDQQKGTGETFDYEQPFVGRTVEIEQLKSFLNPQFLQEDRFVGYYFIRGDAGSGKSRLLHEFRQQLTADYPDRFQWHLAQTEELVRSDFNVFRYWLQAYFNQSAENEPETNKSLFETRFADLLTQISDQELIAELGATKSFIAALLGVFWDDSPYARSPAKGRKDSLETGLILFTIALSQIAPIILQIEDYHWVDRSSAALLQKIVHRFAESGAKMRLCLFIMTRELVDAEEIEGDTNTQQGELLVGSFPIEEIDVFASHIVGEPIASEFVQFLLERTEGNPFFVEQTILYLQEMDGLIRGEEGIMPKDRSTTVSSDIRTVLLARIDRLLPEVQDAVQTAAVLGREFSLNVLRHMLAQYEELDNYVQIASDSTIWTRLVELRYLFKHALLRDVAYQMQLQSRRQALHTLAVNAISALYQADLSPYYSELAYHAEQAQLVDESIHYLREAAEISASNYQNESAVDYFLRCKRILEENIDTEKQAKLFEVNIKLSRMYRLTSQFDYAIDLGQAAVTVAHAQQNMNFVGEAFINMTNTLRGRQSTKGISYGQHAVDYYRSVQNDQKMGSALFFLGDCYLFLANYQQAIVYHNQALDLIGAEDSEHHGAIYISLGYSNKCLGHYQKAISAFEKGMEIFQRLNDIRGYAVGLGNQANIALHLGEYEEAESLYQECLRIARKKGAKRDQVISLALQGLVFSRTARFDRAIQNFNLALEITSTTEIEYYEAEVWYGLAERAFLMANYAEAQRACEKCNELSSNTNYIEMMFTGSILLARILNAQGSKQNALQILANLAPQNLTDAKKADIRFVHWEITGDLADGVAALKNYREISRVTPKKIWLDRVEQLSSRFGQ